MLIGADRIKERWQALLDRLIGPLTVDPYLPHHDAVFEGYYNKVDLESGGHIILIHSRVPDAESNPLMVHVTYVPPWLDRAQPPPFPVQGTLFADDYTDALIQPNLRLLQIGMVDDRLVSLDLKDDPRPNGKFRLECADFLGVEYVHKRHLSCNAYVPNICELNLVVTLHALQISEDAGPAMCNNRLPWAPHDPQSTPAGRLVHLPLPIQWHVHSLSSVCDVRLTVHPGEVQDAILLYGNSIDGRQLTGRCIRNTPTDGEAVHPLDRGRQRATVHIEKNWAQSFPKSYIWVQAHEVDPADPTKHYGICIAGGALISGVDAYLGSYLCPDEPSGAITFAPPLSASLLGWSLGGLTTLIRPDDNRFRLSVVTDLLRTTKLEVFANVADRRTFFPLPAPLARGHVEDYCRQSFHATIVVAVYRRPSVLRAWRLAEMRTFENGSLEFGGDLHRNAMPLQPPPGEPALPSEFVNLRRMFDSERLTTSIDVSDRSGGPPLGGTTTTASGAEVENAQHPEASASPADARSADGLSQ